MILALSIITFYPSLLSASKDDTNDCSRGWTKFDRGDACFQILHRRTKWVDAEKSCIKLGGHLASIKDEYENSFIFDFAKRANLSTPTLWLGQISSSQRNGGYQWHDGTIGRLIEGFRGDAPTGSNVCLTLWSDSGSPAGSWHEWDCAYPAGYSALCRKNKRTDGRKAAHSSSQPYAARPCCVHSACSQKCSSAERCIPNDLDCLFKRCTDGGKGWCLPLP